MVGVGVVVIMRQTKNTERRIRAWLLHRANPHTLILHARYDRNERDEWRKRLKGLVPSTDGVR